MPGSRNPFDPRQPEGVSSTATRPNPMAPTLVERLCHAVRKGEPPWSQNPRHPTSITARHLFEKACREHRGV